MTKQQILEKHKEKRTKCTVWSRCMGYHRPIESFNMGKIGEHKDRIMFEEMK